MFNIEHGKMITIQSYYNGDLSNTKQEYEVSIFSNKDMILKDIIEAMSVLTKGETHKLNLDIAIDQQGRYRLTRKWTVE